MTPMPSLSHTFVARAICATFSPFKNCVNLLNLQRENESNLIDLAKLAKDWFLVAFALPRRVMRFRLAQLCDQCSLQT